MKKILVTGAAGFIGAHLVRALLERGHEVKGLVQPGCDRRNLAGLAAEWVDGDLRDGKTLDAALAGCEVVFHLAAYNNLWAPKRSLPFEINVHGTKKLLERSRAAGVRRFIFTGTATLFRPHNGTSATEIDFVKAPPQQNPYEYSKYLAEKAVLEANGANFETLSLSPTAPIGTGDINLSGPGRLIVDFLTRRIPAYLDTGLNVVDVEAVADAHAEAIEKGRPGERYILGGLNFSLPDFFAILSRVSGVRAPETRVPYWLALSSAHFYELIADWLTHRPPIAPVEGVRLARVPCYYTCEKARQTFALRDTDCEATLAKAITWFQSNGYAA